MKIVTLVPRKPDPHRDKLWVFVQNYWTTLFPDFSIYIGLDESVKFNRSLAVNRAAASAGEWDIAIILDADVICDPRSVNSAIDLAQFGFLTIAGDRRVHLNQKGTQAILRGTQEPWEQKPFVERVYSEHWSSCVVVSRALWDEVEGFDPLFEGWGYEDDAFRCACETMSDAPMVKVTGTIWHLWHPTVADRFARRANKSRADRYWESRFDREATHLLIKERSAVTQPGPTSPTRIPRVLHRTVPETTTREVEHWWTNFKEIHPGWECHTYREPIDPNDWPLTSPYWSKCKNGAQKAGLIRLEALYTYGGFYVDSDVQPVRSFEPLLYSPAVAAWEDETTIPDAIMGAEPKHPAFKQMLDLACKLVANRRNAWESGPGVSTQILKDRNDVLLLPPGSFYPHHYLRKDQTTDNDGPWVFARHMWAGSWLDAKQQRSISRNQRVAKAVR